MELRRPQEDQWAVILPNPASTEAPFKLQRFWVSGLLAHTAYPTPDAALQAALDEGYTETAPGMLDRLAVSAGWRLIYGEKCHSASSIRIKTLPIDVALTAF